MEQTIGESIGQERFTMFVLGIFATVALLLAAVSVYGVIAYFVAQRSHEIGLRSDENMSIVAVVRFGAVGQGGPPVGSEFQPFARTSCQT